ncbi:MAG: signal peptide peptidase SppA [Spirochaetota bacterium]
MKYAIINIQGIFKETEKQVKSLLSSAKDSREFRYDHFLTKTEKILSKDKIDRILIDYKMDFKSGLAGYTAIRSQLKRLKDAGKKVYFYARNFNISEIYLASACTKVLMNPLGEFSLLGLAVKFPFVKKLLDNNNIEVEVIRRDKYKSAGDIFRLESIDEANKEQYEAILETCMKEMTEKIKEGYGKRDEDINELLKGKALTPNEALEKGWIHEIKIGQDLIDDWKEEKHKKYKLRKIKNHFGRGPKIAVLVFEGAIKDGKSEQDPLLGQMIGADSYIPHIKQLIKDKSIQGVVFRVNSGGGSAIASEEIVNEIRKLRKEKPVVVSMSNVAGSGGYWISTQCEKLFAERTTITGSIGVIFTFFYIKELLNKYGINFSTIKKGKYADFASNLRRLSEEEREELNKFIEDIYQKFLNKVADFRNKTVEDIHKIAQGRVWSGEDAKEIGIIDEIGGLTDAINYLKGTLKLEESKIIYYPVIKKPLLARLIANTSLTGIDMPNDIANIIKHMDIHNSYLVKNSNTPLALMTDFIDFL